VCNVIALFQVQKLPCRMPSGHRGETEYSLTFILTSALDGVGVKSRSDRFIPGKMTMSPLYRRVGGLGS